MVSLTIDDRPVTVADGTTILEAASLLGIRIPTLCWLAKVSPTGACRLCAVEVEGVDRPMTSCDTPVKEGMRVVTVSDSLDRNRRKTLQLMLVNHPLDCPVCDAAGECGLQDACYDLGVTGQTYSAPLERKRIRYDWGLLESDPNRCILCEKCVKVDHEIVGADAIAVVGCGEGAVIDTLDGGPLSCEFCGNCIAACPTGTLISRPFKFRARPWALTVTESVCSFCPVGCGIEYHTRGGRVERVTSDDRGYNSGNLCINGRFGYSYLNSPRRLTTPLIRNGEDLEPADWDSAMQEAVTRLRRISEYYGPDAIAGICSPRLNNEEIFLFRKLMAEAIGTPNIDSVAGLGYSQAMAALDERLGISGASAPIDRIERADAVLVIGCDPNGEATGIEYRVIRAVTKNDANLVLANMRDVKLRKYSNCHLKYRPGGESNLLNGIVKALLDQGLEDGGFVGSRTDGVEELRKELGALTLDGLAASAGVNAADLEEAARLLGGGKSVAIILGADLVGSAHQRQSMDALANLALVTGALEKDRGGIFPLHEKGNIRGVLDMLSAPLSPSGFTGGASYGRGLWEIIDGIEEGRIKALYVAAADLLAFPDSGRIGRALSRLDLLIVQDIFPSETTRFAHVVFPGSAAAEKSGTFTTMDNRLMRLAQAVTPPGNARDDFAILSEVYSRYARTRQVGSRSDILRVIEKSVPGYGGICNAMEGAGQIIMKEMAGHREGSYRFASVTPPAALPGDSGFSLLVGPILFHNGTTTTRSENNLTVAPDGYVEMLVDDAERLGVGEGDSLRLSNGRGSITGKARLSRRLQPGLLFAPHHFRELNASSLLEGNRNIAEVRVERV